MQLNRILAITVLASLAFTSCSVPPPHSSDGPESQWAKSNMRYRLELAEQKAKLNRQGQAPQIEELGEDGSFLVWRWSLDGWPGNEYVKMRFTYRNTTKRSFDYVRVWLEIRDADGKVISKDEHMLSHPLAYTFHPGASWTDTFRVKLNGANRNKRGWYWKLGAKPLDIRIFGGE